MKFFELPALDFFDRKLSDFSKLKKKFYSNLSRILGFRADVLQNSKSYPVKI